MSSTDIAEAAGCFLDRTDQPALPQQQRIDSDSEFGQRPVIESDLDSASVSLGLTGRSSARTDVFRGSMRPA